MKMKIIGAVMAASLMLAGCGKKKDSPGNSASLEKQEDTTPESLNSFPTSDESKTTPEANAKPATPSFDGDWRGTVKSVAGSAKNLQYQFRIVINGEMALAYRLVNDKWVEIPDSSFGVVKYTVSKKGDMCVVNWLNQDLGYVWTEEQTYSLSYLNRSKLWLDQFRHVTNREKNKNNSSWFYVCSGALTKTKEN